MKLVEFKPAENKAERKKFIQLPWDIYKGDSAWVPPLRLTVEDAIDTKKNPFYAHAKITCWNAYTDDGRHLGRIAAIVDDAHNKFHDEKMGFWGFFECVNDQKVANELFAVAEQWVKAQGMTAIRGPANPSLNHECGLVVNAFEKDPFMMMTHNPPYYVQLVEKAGHAKVKDLLAFEMPCPEEFSERNVKIAQRVLKKSGLTIRQVNMKDFQNEVAKIAEIYNTAWEKNWGFVPMSPDEFKHMAKNLKDVIWPEFCVLAFAGDRPVAFALTLPDINQVLKTIPSGKLLPFGIFKLLTGLKPKAKKINRLRVITLGVIPEYRASGIANVLYVEAFNQCKKMGLWGAEISWILEDNKEMLAAIEAFCGNPPYKTFRLYQKSV